MQAAFPTTDVRAAALFSGQPGAQSMVMAALTGMGRVWTDSPLHPRCAIAAAGDFLICGGRPGPSAARMLRTALRSDNRDWLIQAQGAWADVLARVAPGKEITRWAFDHRVQPNDETLRAVLKKMPAGAAFQPIEGAWIARCRAQTWSEDFVSLYSDADYAQKGLGVLLMIGGEMVAGASSYVSYPGGVEVQLQTRDDVQGRGYATLAAARLILMAHERGLIATWDAANEASCHIACKLGYRLEGAYRVFSLSQT